MLIFFPSIHPSLFSSCRNASRRTAIPEAVFPSRKPMRKTFPVCCASTEPQSAKSRAQRVSTVIFFFMFFPALSIRHSCYVDVKSRTHESSFFFCLFVFSDQERLAAMRGTAPGRHTDLKCAPL